MKSKGKIKTDSKSITPRKKRKAKPRQEKGKRKELYKAVIVNCVDESKRDESKYAATEIYPLTYITKKAIDITFSPPVRTDYAENPEIVLQKTDYAAAEIHPCTYITEIVTNITLNPTIKQNRNQEIVKINGKLGKNLLDFLFSSVCWSGTEHANSKKRK